MFISPISCFISFALLNYAIRFKKHAIQIPKIYVLVSFVASPLTLEKRGLYFPLNHLSPHDPQVRFASSPPFLSSSLTDWLQRFRVEIESFLFSSLKLGKGGNGT